MGNRLGEQDGYPVGVSNADFVGTEEPLCTCHHSADEHDWEGRCEVCGCTHYLPEEES